MRGKGCQVNFCFNFHRITPAYAGKSASTFPTALTAEDHPRLCGEKLRMPASQMTVRGSPPPMRGKGHQQRRLADCEGITPAYAGKRADAAAAIRFIKDHPRLCGEKFLTDKFSRSYVGSPPPMRGKARFQKIGTIQPRITPAYAGKSLTGTVWTRPPRDHPRLCGEKIY